MAVINCKEGIRLFDTQAMMKKMETELGRELPDATKARVEKELPPKLNAKVDDFCSGVCAGHGCQAKNIGAEPLGTFIGHEVLKDLVLKVLTEADPSGGNGDLSSPTTYVQ